MARNIEVKARVESLEPIRDRALAADAERVGFLHQRDTYFNCRNGRLKLRETEGQQAQLVWYHRADDASVRSSDYQLTEIDEHAESLKQSLAGALGVLAVVEKSRELFLYENVRIHLDHIEGLGEFVELEAVLGPDDDDHDGQRIVGVLLSLLEITHDQFESRSYADMATTS